MTAHGTGFPEAITGATGLKLIITAASCRPALRRGVLGVSVGPARISLAGPLLVARRARPPHGGARSRAQL